MSRTTFAPGFTLPQPARARETGARGVESPAAAQPYAWLPAHIRRAMSPRARRLMRADY